MIAVVDYGAGNLTSVARALAAVGATVTVTRSAADIAQARAVVIPGVGHFDATRGVNDEMRAALVENARRKPMLGICLGLHFLFEGSDESPGRSGLGLLEGRCVALPADASTKVPHTGWNSVDRLRRSQLLDGLPPTARFYFTHSYAVPVTSACVGRTDYAMPFASVIESGSTFATQFHPEKSGEAGLRVLRNFIDVV